MDYKLNLGHSLDGMSLPWGNASNGHIALLGQSGRGKSYAIKHFLSQLPEQGVHAYIFDCSGDFRESSMQEILKSTRINILDVRQQARVNPFRSLQLTPYYTEEAGDTAARLTEAILDAYRFRGTAQPVHLRRAINLFMQAFPHSTSFANLISFIEADSERAAKMEPSLVRLEDLSRLFSGGNGCDWQFDKPGITILQFDTIPDRASQSLITELLLSDLWADKLQASKDTCPVVVLLDECQRFSFNDSSMLVRILREGRKYHVNGWFAFQWIDNKTAVQALEQAALRGYFYPGDRQVHSLAKVLCSDTSKVREYETLIRRLTVGQFLYTDASGHLLIDCVPRL